MQRSYIILAVLAIFGFGACTDVIDVELAPAVPELAVDAWLTNESKPQKIRLTLSQPYFDNAFTPGVTGADVAVADSLGNVFLFEDQGNGDYIWTPQAGQTLGPVGMTFFLGIETNGKQYFSQTTMNRVPEIDSIRVEFRENELGFADGHWAELMCRDLAGTDDLYWIKSYKNGVFLNKPFELNIAYDAGFDRGSQIDGVTFITPIREAINRVPDTEGEDNDEVPPWAPGDTITVEVHSISLFAFEFLSIARDQMTNGANTIFALPLANTRGNVINVETEETALGMFCVSAVSTDTKVVE